MSAFCVPYVPAAQGSLPRGGAPASLLRTARNTVAPQVKTLANKILSKKPSPGWEYERSGMKLKACKLHLHEVVSGEMVVWSACCVYVSDFSEQQAYTPVVGSRSPSSPTSPSCRSWAKEVGLSLT